MENREESGTVLVEEAMALALAGRHGEAMSLLISGAGSGSGGDLDGTRPPAERLTLARLLELRGTDADRARARRLLAALAAENGATGWRATLALARIARTEMRYEEAATHLKEVLAAFRGDAPLRDDLTLAMIQRV